VATIIVTIFYALRWRSVWALVVGGIAGAAVRLVLSHTYLPGERNKLMWDRDSARVLRGYGKWIYLSSILFFVAMQSDRLMVGRFLSMAALGIYAIAMNLIDPLVNINQRIWRTVMLPAMSRIYRETPERFSEVLYRGRLRTDCLFAVASGAVMVLGTTVVSFLYDPRYSAAGALLQIIAVRSTLCAFVEPLEASLSAMRLPKLIAISHVGRTSWILAGIPLGWYLGGLKGIALAAATAEIPVVLTFWFVLGRMGVARAKYELRTFLLGACGVAAPALLAAIIPSTWHFPKPW
jgi:O-antigen/teichoic acid export membrane protein